MARLPTVSGDSNAWGSILNDFLNVSHNSDGTLNNRPINLKDHCAIDGVTDDSAGFTTAYTLASSLGVGLWHPGGTLVKGNDTILPLVHIFGAGKNVSIIKLKNGANADLFSAQTGSINLSASGGIGAQGTVYGFGFHDLTLDGNKANQSAGPCYPLRFYGYDYVLENLEVKNGYSGNILSDWNAGNNFATDSMESQWINVKTHDSNGIGIEFGGPHDSQFLNVIPYQEAGHCIHLAPNASGSQFINAHPWLPGSGKVAVLCEAPGTYWANCQAESSDTVQVVVLGSGFEWVGGNAFGGSPFTCSGFQIGQQGGQTPYSGQILQSGGVTQAYNPTNCRIQSRISNCIGANGAIWLANDGGANLFDVTVDQGSGDTFTGTMANSTHARIIPFGITANGSRSRGGYFKFAGNSFNAFEISDGTNVQYNVNTNAGEHRWGNGAYVRLYSDNFNTALLEFGTGFLPKITFGNDSAAQVARLASGVMGVTGALATAQSATTPDPGAGGTITTASTGLSRVTPAASRTGVILQAGTVAGQKCTVVNNSASFTITFAAAATSNVAQGVALVIAALGKYDFTWDSVAARWY